MTTEETTQPDNGEEEEAPTEPGQASEGEEFTETPNEVQQPTPAGDDFAQEGGPTVEDQAINVANNELTKQQEAS
jgi:hypothetical protein